MSGDDRNEPADGVSTAEATESRETATATAVGEERLAAEATTPTDVDDDSLRARVRRLEEENQRLREQYVGVRERRYRRTAVALALVGAGFGAVGVVVGSARDVLFALAAVGLFGAVLTRYLTPEEFIPLDVGEGIYATMADNEAAVVDQLGLSSTRVYVATDRGPRLFVPELDAYDETLLAEVTDGADDPLTRPLVVGDRAARSGLSVRPVAAPLLDAFDEQHSGPLPAVPREAVNTLGEGVTDALELARDVDIDLDADDGRVTFSVHDPLYGDVTRFDHPVVSFLGSGLARALETPVTVDVVTDADDDTPFVTCRWNPDDVGAETDGGNGIADDAAASDED